MAASLKLIYYPDPRLRLKSEPITVFDKALRETVDGMQKTMIHAKGIGLAAIQVAIPKRLLIVDIGDLDADEEYIEGDGESERRLSERKTISNLEVFVNPEIIEADGDIEYEEGCLSVPGVHAVVKRNEHLKVRYQDLDGKTHEIETHGLRSIVIQHELDHLNGIVFPDRLSSIQKMMVLSKYKKLQAEKDLEPEEG
ncbi:MAG: peptide deformylase [Bdellovibrionota bacterium]